MLCARPCAPALVHCNGCSYCEPTGNLPISRSWRRRSESPFTSNLRLPSIDWCLSGNHQGVIALIAAKSYDTTEQILERAKTRGEKPFLVLLDGVEDPHNLGAVLRTAEAAGVHGVFIPERRAVGLTSVVAKVSAGALDHISVGRVGNLIRLIQDLKEAGLWIYGVDPQAAKLHTDIDMTGPIALVLGGEGEGLRPGVLKECDDRIRIPMQGRIQSLNVSAAAAVTLFEVVRQRRKGVVPAANSTES